MKRWCANVCSTSECNYQSLTRYKQNVVLAAMLKGILLPSNMQITLLCWKITVPQNISLKIIHFLWNSGCRIIFVCSVNFWHQQDSNSLFKGSIGQTGLLILCDGAILHIFWPQIASDCTIWGKSHNKFVKEMLNSSKVNNKFYWFTTKESLARHLKPLIVVSGQPFSFRDKQCGQWCNSIM